VTLASAVTYILTLLLYYLSTAVCPPGFSDLCFGQGACTGPPPLSTSIKVRALPAARPSSSSIHSQHPSLGRLTLSCAIDPSPPKTHSERPVAGPPQLKSLDGTAGLKPEPSILLDLPLWIRCSRLSRRRSFLWMASHCPRYERELSSLPPFSLPHHHNPRGNASLGDCGTATLEACPWHSLHAIRPGQWKKCRTTTWPASAWLRRGITRRGKDLGGLPCTGETTTCAVCLDLG
jgi:hypothetical protein